jgi:outer membrane protein OmpA-like peptidoglycan-associated protein
MWKHPAARFGIYSQIELMGRANTTWQELSRGISVPADEQHTLVVERNYADVIEIDARHFVEVSSVLLPAPNGPPSQRELLGMSGPSVLAHALRYAKGQSDRKLVVFAHDDAPDAGVAAVLSELRAQNVHALLTGDKAAFAASCSYTGRGTAEALLSWASRCFGYGCDPALVGDGDRAAALERAVRRFRQAHNSSAGTSLTGGATLERSDLEAFAELYDRALARELEVELSELAGYRSALVFCEPAWIGCGGRWAVPSGPDALQLMSASKRRVDLVFFETATPIPDLTVKPAGVRVFADQRYARCIYLPPEPPPAVTCTRLAGMFFDSNKCFLLPSAMSGMRALVASYEEHPFGELLIVGHTDTVGRPAYNDALSLERAKAVAAFLKDDVQAWLAFYGDDKPQLKRWGKSEDLAMIGALPDGATHLEAVNPIRSYQAARGLDVDGIAGKDTRTQLITEYMSLDGTTLPASLKPVLHGCGESFPAVPSGDDVEQDENRRVELFLFDEAIEPAPSGEISGPDSTEYGEWRARVVRDETFTPSDERNLRIVVEIPCRDGSDLVDDARFRLTFGDEVTEGRTDAEGIIVLPRPDVIEGLLEVWVDGDAQPPIEWNISVADLPAFDDRAGARLRLANLGFFYEEGGDADADAEDEALLAFQQWNGVSDQDPFGEPTQLALKQTIGVA